jgi:hypothetical protein
MNGFEYDPRHTDECIRHVPGTTVIDAKAIYDTLTSQNQPLQLQEKRTALELLAYLKNTEANGTKTRWVHGGANLGDGLTKLGAAQMLREFLETSTWSIVFDENQVSGKKRKTLGKDTLENQGALNTSEPCFMQLAWAKLRQVYPSFGQMSDDESSEQE